MVIYVRGNPIGSFHLAKVKSHASLLGKGLSPTTIATAGKWIKRCKLEGFPNDFRIVDLVWSVLERCWNSDPKKSPRARQLYGALSK